MFFLVHAYLIARALRSYQWLSFENRGNGSSVDYLNVGTTRYSSTNDFTNRTANSAKARASSASFFP